MTSSDCATCGHCISQHHYPSAMGPDPCMADGCACKDYRSQDAAQQARVDAYRRGKPVRDLVAMALTVVVVVGLFGGLLTVVRAAL